MRVCGRETEMWRRVSQAGMNRGIEPGPAEDEEGEEAALFLYSTIILIIALPLLCSPLGFIRAGLPRAGSL